MDYAEDLIKLKEHVRQISDALLHKRYEDVHTLIKASRMRLDKIDGWIAATTAKVQE